MLFQRRGLLKRLLDDDPGQRKPAIRDLLRAGDRRDWRALMTAPWPSAAARERLQREVLDLAEPVSAARTVAHLDRVEPDWRGFVAALSERYPSAVRPALLEHLRAHAAPQVVLGLVGLSALGANDREAAEAVRALIITGEPVNDPDTVGEAVAALGRMGDPPSVELLTQLCRSPEGWRRQAAALALAEIGTPETIRTILAAVDDPHIGSPVVAARLARRLDLARTLKARDRGLATAALALVRAIAEGLGRSLPITLLPRLRVVDQVRSLLEVYETRPVPAVIEAVLAIRDAVPRQWWPAFAACTVRGPSGGASNRPPTETAEGGGGTLAAPAADIRATRQALIDVQSLLRAASPGGGPDKSLAVRFLTEGLQDPDEAYLRRCVVCLGRLRASAAVEPLLGLLPNLWGPARREVIEALGLIGRDAAAPALLEALKARLDERHLTSIAPGPAEREEVQALYRALCRLSGAVPLWVFRSALEEEDEETRRAAAAGLEGMVAIHDREAADLLAEAVRGDPSPAVRAAAARSLGHATAAHASEVLIQALGDRSEAVRAAAARALGRIGSLLAIDPLRRLLRQGDPTGEAALALGRLEGGGVPTSGLLDALIQIAGDPSDVPRAAEALQVLGRFDIYEAQVALERLSKDTTTDPALREAAEHARWKRTPAS